MWSWTVMVWYTALMVFNRMLRGLPVISSGPNSVSTVMVFLLVGWLHQVVDQLEGYVESWQLLPLGTEYVNNLLGRVHVEGIDGEGFRGHVGIEADGSVNPVDGENVQGNALG